MPIGTSFDYPKLKKKSHQNRKFKSLDCKLAASIRVGSSAFHKIQTDILDEIQHQFVKHGMELSDRPYINLLPEKEQKIICKQHFNEQVLFKAQKLLFAGEGNLQICSEAFALLSTFQALRMKIFLDQNIESVLADFEMHWIEFESALIYSYTSRLVSGIVSLLSESVVYCLERNLFQLEDVLDLEPIMFLILPRITLWNILKLPQDKCLKYALKYFKLDFEDVYRLQIQIHEEEIKHPENSSIWHTMFNHPPTKALHRKLSTKGFLYSLNKLSLT